MADQKAPDYTLAPTLTFDITDQYRELFEDTRMQIVDLLLERAATIKELAETLDLPKGTIGHHVAVLEKAGLIKVVRTKKVRRPVARSGQFCIPIPRLGHDAARIDTRGPDRRLARAPFGREWALRSPFLAAAAVTIALFAYALPNLNTSRIEEARSASEPESTLL